jgi:hypothetical protein
VQLFFEEKIKKIKIEACKQTIIFVFVDEFI